MFGNITVLCFPWMLNEIWRRLHCRAAFTLHVATRPPPPSPSPFLYSLTHFYQWDADLRCCVTRAPLVVVVAVGAIVVSGFIFVQLKQQPVP